MCHRNAPLTPTGRMRLAWCIVEDDWPLRRAAERFQISHTTAKRWADRYRLQGWTGMYDRSSRPHHSPTRTPASVEEQVVQLPPTPHRIQRPNPGQPRHQRVGTTHLGPWTATFLRCSPHRAGCHRTAPAWPSHPASDVKSSERATAKATRQFPTGRRPACRKGRRSDGLPGWRSESTGRPILQCCAALPVPRRARRTASAHRGHRTRSRPGAASRQLAANAPSPRTVRQRAGPFACWSCRPCSRSVRGPWPSPQ